MPWKWMVVLCWLQRRFPLFSLFQRGYVVLFLIKVLFGLNNSLFDQPNTGFWSISCCSSTTSNILNSGQIQSSTFICYLWAPLALVDSHHEVEGALVSLYVQIYRSVPSMTPLLVTKVCFVLFCCCFLPQGHMVLASIIWNVYINSFCPWNCMDLIQTLGVTLFPGDIVFFS